MRRNRSLAMVIAALMIAAAAAGLVLAAPQARAQNVDLDEILDSLERTGYYLEPGADGTDAGFADLVRFAEPFDDTWYFASLVSSVDPDFADQLRDEVTPIGNVLVLFIDDENFFVTQLSSPYSDSVEARALEAFDSDWVTPDDYMREVVADLDAAVRGDSGGGGSGAGWLWIAVPVAAGGGAIWFVSRRNKKKREQERLETAQKIRAEIQTELDELANDVIVLSSPVDLSDKPEAVRHYREATEVYTAISEEMPDIDELETADLRELSELGARVVHARWQMDAAEAILDGEPIPEKPKVEPPPPPPEPTPTPKPTRPRSPMPPRQPRPRVPYSRGPRRRSGGGLLDVLIAGAGTLGTGSRRGSGSRAGTARRTGGVFGGGSSTRSGSTRSGSSSRRSGAGRSTSRRSTSRRSSSSSRRSTSRRRRR